MVVPDTHDSVRSHSCGCCSFSRSRQGLLQLTQGWNKTKGVSKKEYIESKNYMCKTVGTIHNIFQQLLCAQIKYISH